MNFDEFWMSDSCLVVAKSRLGFQTGALFANWRLKSCTVDLLFMRVPSCDIRFSQRLFFLTGSLGNWLTNKHHTHTHIYIYNLFNFQLLDFQWIQIIVTNHNDNMGNLEKNIQHKSTSLEVTRIQNGATVASPWLSPLVAGVVCLYQWNFLTKQASRSVAKRGDLPAVSDYSSGKWPLVDSLIIGE